MNLIRIGTRGSKLALWQANFVAEKLLKGGWNTQLVTIDTRGDQVLDVSIAKIGDKGVFTEELEEQLFNGKIDIAVHSAKDLQSRLADDFKVLAFTRREEPFDVLLSNNKQLDLTQKITVGTSSTRRTALLKRHYPQVTAVQVRGNLQTRIRKMEEGHCDALLLAWAGVHRMGYADKVVQKIPLDVFIPPVGQGTIAIECSKNLDNKIAGAVRELVNDEETELCLRAERAYLARLEGGCSIPSFCHAQTEEGRIIISGGIVSLNGEQMVRITLEGDAGHPETLGNKLADQILDDGGAEILEEIRKEL
ncbi:MAG: hydroxymethylbilane synthase [Cyclobacteriaceae bacterium]|nr:hydroxymethylbilane synthase [Cyclobacteriaceae bacterium]